MNPQKKIAIFTTIVILLFTALAISLPKLLPQDTFGLQASGTFYGNLSDFGIDFENGKPTELSQAYLNSISYNVISIDKDAMEATIEVSIPDISSILSDTLDKIISENSNASYSKLISLAETTMTSTLQTVQTQKEPFQIVLPLQQNNGSYQLVPNDEWNQLIFGNLGQQYTDCLHNWIGGMTNENSK